MGLVSLLSIRAASSDGVRLSAVPNVLRKMTMGTLLFFSFDYQKITSRYGSQCPEKTDVGNPPVC